MGDGAQPVLEMKGITKQFFGNMVLNAVDLSVRAGEIHGLVGENGAGKSTLMNILFGMPVIHSTGGFKGEIFLGGNPVTIASPAAAMALGIGMVHQEFMLLPGFTITENIKLNRELTRPNFVSRALKAPQLEPLDIASMRRDARAALDRLGLTIDEWAPVAGLPVGHMQFIEIAREIDKRHIKVLVFDEPTAVLTESEAQRLLSALRALAGNGTGILFISHRLDEIVEVADRITVLRDGEVVGRIPRGEAKIEKIAQLMVGRKIEKTELSSRAAQPEKDDVVLSIEDLYADMPGEKVKGVNLEVRRGEILGIGGLAGQGKLGIANGVMGLYPARGMVRKNGVPVPLNDPGAALNMGLAFVSEDRRGVGLLLDRPVDLNIALTAMQVKGRFMKRNLLGPAMSLADARAMRAHAEHMIRDLDIRCRGTDEVVRRLSGGNQQKVCLARALTLEPEVLLVSEPTRGIDIGAKKLVLDILVKLNREKGTTIVMTSSELAELRRICDRIAIIDQGKVAGVLAPDALDEEFGILMAGGKRREVI